MKAKQLKYAFALIIFLMITGALVFSLAPQKTHESEVSDARMYNPTIFGYPAVVRSALIRKLIEQKIYEPEITIEDVQKFDLSQPHTSIFKNDPQLSIFYGYKNTEMFDFYQKIINSVSNSKGYIFSLANRIEGMKTSQPELLAILPIKEERVCRAIVKKVKGIKQVNINPKIPVLDKPINLLPHPKRPESRQIATIPGNESVAGCVEEHGAFYFYQVIHDF